MDTNESKIYRIFLISAGILLAIFFYYLFTVIRLQARHRRYNLTRLGKQVIMLENHRKQISENLHDELAPMITAAKMHISSVTGIDKVQTDNILQAVELMNQLTARIRVLSANLLPNILEHKGLIRALEEYIFYLSAPSSPLIVLNAKMVPSITYYRSILIYRILQEIIHNTCKHAKASQLQILLYTQKKQLVISTADNGIGFNYTAKLKSPTGIGLTGMLSRINVLEGTFKVDENTHGTGTRYYITIPLNDNPTFKFNEHENSNYTN